LAILKLDCLKIRDKGKIVSAGYQGGGGKREGVGERRGWGKGREMTQTLCAHMNKKRKINKIGLFILMLLSYSTFITVDFIYFRY
jgi:hypothetical protein